MPPASDSRRVASRSSCGRCDSRAPRRSRSTSAGRPSAGPAVRDRRSPIATEGLRAELDAGRGLATLVLGTVDEGERALDDVGVELLEELLPRAVELDVGLEDGIESGIGRDRV